MERRTRSRQWALGSEQCRCQRNLKVTPIRGLPAFPKTKLGVVVIDPSLAYTLNLCLLYFEYFYSILCCTEYFPLAQSALWTCLADHARGAPRLPPNRPLSPTHKNTRDPPGVSLHRYKLVIMHKSSKHSCVLLCYSLDTQNMVEIIPVSVWIVRLWAKCWDTNWHVTSLKRCRLMFSGDPVSLLFSHKPGWTTPEWPRNWVHTVLQTSTIVLQTATVVLQTSTIVKHQGAEKKCCYFHQKGCSRVRSHSNQYITQAIVKHQGTGVFFIHIYVHCSCSMFMKECFKCVSHLDWASLKHSAHICD